MDFHKDFDWFSIICSSIVKWNHPISCKVNWLVWIIYNMTSARLLSSLHLVLIEHCHTLQGILVCELHLIVHYHGSILWHPNLHHLCTNIMMHKLKMVLINSLHTITKPYLQMYATQSFRIPCPWSFRAFFESSHATQLLHDLAQYLYTQDNETWQPFAKEDVEKCCLLCNMQSPTTHSILMNTFTFVLFLYGHNEKNSLQREKSNNKPAQTLPSFDIEDYLYQHLLRQCSWMCPRMFLTLSPNRLPLSHATCLKGPIFVALWDLHRFWDSRLSLMFRPHIEEEQQQNTFGLLGACHISSLAEQNLFSYYTCLSPFFNLS